MNNEPNNLDPIVPMGVDGENETASEEQIAEVRNDENKEQAATSSLAQGVSALSEGKLFDLEQVKAVLAEKRMEVSDEEGTRVVQSVPPIPVFSVEEPDGMPYKDAPEAPQKAESDAVLAVTPAVELFEQAGEEKVQPDWEELRRRRKEAERYNNAELAEYERAQKKRKRDQAQKKQQSSQEQIKRAASEADGTRMIPKQREAVSGEKRERTVRPRPEQQQTRVESRERAKRPRPVQNTEAQRERNARPRPEQDTAKRRNTANRPVRRRDDGIIRAEELDTGKPKRNPVVRFLLTSLKWIIYFAVIISISVYGGQLAVRWANDAFAFVKESKEVKVTIPENATTQEVALILAESGIISEPDLFRIFTMLKKNDGLYLGGEYTLDTSMDYSTIMSKLKYTYKPARETLRFTIPEGYTLEQIVALLVKHGLGTEEEFWQALQYGKFNYEFLADLPKSKTRLEGFIFPDTYEVYKDEGAESVIKRLLSNFNKKFKDEYYERAQELNMSVLQVVTLASIIEKEAVNVAEFSLVSSVFHNRLNSPDKYPYLQSCATIQYVLPERKQVLSVEDTKIDSPYNTYTNKGLPPGPISNPGEAAIYAALYPDTTNYYFFVASGNNHVFSTSYDAHLTAIRNVGSQAQGTGTIID